MNFESDSPELFKQQNIRDSLDKNNHKKLVKHNYCSKWEIALTRDY